MSYLVREMRRVLYAIAVLLLGVTSVSAGPLPVVTGAVFEISTGETTITWDDADDPNLSYNIYRASDPIDAENLILARRIASRVPSGTGSFVFQVIDSGQSHYAVLPVNTSGVENQTFTVNVAGPISETDITPPSPVQLTGEFEGMTIKLSWGPVDAKNVEGIVRWQVNRKIDGGDPEVVSEYLLAYDPTGETSDQPVPITGLYEYSATAIDSSGNPSAEGNWIPAANLPDLAMSSADSIAYNTDLAIAKTFPIVSQPVQMTLTVRNIGAVASPESAVTIADGVAFAVQEVVPAIPPQDSADVTFPYTPSTTGTVPLAFTLDLAGAVAEINESNNSATVQIPVVTNDLYVVWYGEAQDLKYANIPMIGPSSIDEWKRRGAHAATYADPYQAGAPAQVLIDYYSGLLDSGFDTLVIDELGWDDPGVTDPWMEAFAAIKQSYPDCFIAVWYIGVLSQQMTQLVLDGTVDLLVFEIYLTHDDPDWQSKLQYYINQATTGGILDRCICGLGTNTNYSGGLTAQQHADFIEQQIVYIRANAPAMPGVGFFDWRTIPGERELIDDLCRQYFVD